MLDATCLGKRPITSKSATIGLGESPTQHISKISNSSQQVPESCICCSYTQIPKLPQTQMHRSLNAFVRINSKESRRGHCQIGVCWTGETQEMANREKNKTLNEILNSMSRGGGRQWAGLSSGWRPPRRLQQWRWAPWPPRPPVEDGGGRLLRA